MKILFTADWHIKLGQKNVPTAWALNRYQKFFEQIYSIEHFYDLHIIGGDIFDRLPTLEELEVFFSFISKVTIPTIIYDGNHEATRKNHTFLSHLQEACSKINKNIEIITEIRIEDSFSILPYADLHRAGSVEKLPTDRPVFTHVRGEIPPHVHPEVDLDRFSSFPIVFAGDLHSHSNTQRNIVYPGSPMTISFHRSEVETGYITIDTHDWSWRWERFELPQLIRKTVSSSDEMVKTEYNHTIYEVEGSMSDLTTVQNSDLLDKKVVKRSGDTTLILDKGMSVQEELLEYLSWVLELDDEDIKKAMNLFSEYSKDAV